MVKYMISTPQHLSGPVTENEAKQALLALSAKVPGEIRWHGAHQFRQIERNDDLGVTDVKTYRAIPIGSSGVTL